MSRTRQHVVSAIGWSLLGTIFYTLAITLLQFTAVLMVDAGWLVSANPLNFFQRNYYMTGRPVWQNEATCAQADKALIYMPRNGTCSFSSAEFATTLTFDEVGRAVPARAGLPALTAGIAVLGDSHAMGWGVNDAETFANVLQQGTPKPVYNLAVSSYGTERELKRLVVSGVINKVDTVIIQYCDNDLGENAAQLTEAEYLRWSEFFSQQTGIQQHSLRLRIGLIVAVMGNALREPLAALVTAISGGDQQDFAVHHQYLLETLQRYQAVLQDKRVLVFYVNEHGKQFAGFPLGRDSRLPWVEFIDPGLTPSHYLIVDDHMNAAGHRHIGEYLAGLLK